MLWCKCLTTLKLSVKWWQGIVSSLSQYNSIRLVYRWWAIRKDSKLLTECWRILHRMNYIIITSLKGCGVTNREDRQSDSWYWGNHSNHQKQWNQCSRNQNLIMKYRYCATVKLIILSVLKEVVHRSIISRGHYFCLMERKKCMPIHA